MHWSVSFAFLFAQLLAILAEGGRQYNSNKIKTNSKTLNVKAGDVVKVIAPSYRSTETFLLLIRFYIESLGLVADISENIYSEADPIYSNTDEFRANDLISAILDENVKIIWCIRGGSGTIRIIPFLEDRLPVSAKHKIFIGYSDATALHIYFQYKYGWQTIHGLMLEEIAFGYHSPLNETVMTTLDMVYERRDKICVPATRMNDFNVTLIESEVVGGNSAMVESSIGTVWEVNNEGRIFFLEDIGDNGEHIEKRLDRMIQSQTFNGVLAVVFGDFAEAESDELIDFALDRFAESAPFPVFRITEMGHGPVNYPLPLLTHSKINSEDGGLTYDFCVDNRVSGGNGDHSIENFYTGSRLISAMTSCKRKIKSESYEK